MTRWSPRWHAVPPEGVARGRTGTARPVRATGAGRPRPGSSWASDPRLSERVHARRCQPAWCRAARGVTIEDLAVMARQWKSRLRVTSPCSIGV